MTHCLEGLGGELFADADHNGMTAEMAAKHLIPGIAVGTRSQALAPGRPEARGWLSSTSPDPKPFFATL